MATEVPIGVGTLPVMGMILDEARIARVLQEADAALGDCVDPQSRVAFEVHAHVVTANRPRSTC